MKMQCEYALFETIWWQPRDNITPNITSDDSNWPIVNKTDYKVQKFYLPTQILRNVTAYQGNSSSGMCTSNKMQWTDTEPLCFYEPIQRIKNREKTISTQLLIQSQTKKQILLHGITNKLQNKSMSTILLQIMLSYIDYYLIYFGERIWTTIYERK